MAAISGLIRVMERPRARPANACVAISARSSTCRSRRRGRPTSSPRPTSTLSGRLWDELRAARPDWGFLMEEGGEIPGEPDKPRFIIDPLDGTSNFLHGMPHFAISIAVQEPRSMDRAGAMSPPGSSISRSPTRASGRKRPAAPGFRIGRLRVSARRHLDESLIATGIPFAGAGDPGSGCRIYGALAPQVAGIRRFGAASLDLAWVAAGRYDGFWEAASSRGTRRPAACWCARRAAS
jgi:myo-inositol-1(or 4)-monophosphatase